MTLWTAVLLAAVICVALKTLGYLVPPRWLEAPRPARIADLLTVALLAASPLVGGISGRYFEGLAEAGPADGAGHGVAAHASATPYLGRNALDAVALNYQAVGLLRQHIPPTDRVHGVIREGGDRPSVVPERATVEYYVRSAHAQTLLDLLTPVTKSWPSEMGLVACHQAIQVHGGYGYSTEYDVERYLRDAPLMIVGEGTNEIQRNVIAAQLVSRGKL